MCLTGFKSFFVLTILQSALSFDNHYKSEHVGQYVQQAQVSVAENSHQKQLNQTEIRTEAGYEHDEQFIPPVTSTIINILYF